MPAPFPVDADTQLVRTAVQLPRSVILRLDEIRLPQHLSRSDMVRLAVRRLLETAPADDPASANR